MSKYLAVIQDSFREAMASRVLWMMLVLITLLLLAIAPLGYVETATTRLVEHDFNERFVAVVRDGGKTNEPGPAKRIYELVDEKLQRLLDNVNVPGVDKEQDTNPFGFMRAVKQLQEQTNELLQRRDFFDDASFAKVNMTSNELRDLRNQSVDEMSDNEVARFNRLLLEAAFPDIIRVSPPTSLQFRYLYLNVFDPVPLSGDSLRDTLQDNTRGVLRWFVGAIGILIAILVTSPIIPQMFDPGSLHLLLSKPIARSLLLLAKYVGGCAFIAICVAYLITGIWFLLGVRFGVWDPKLLLSIPIYLFVFAVYYAVSTFLGVYYRSPIVCIALTILFWGICFAIGTTKGTFETMYWNKSKLTDVFSAGETLIAVNEIGIAHDWNATERRWQEMFVSNEQRQSRGLMYFMPRIEPVFRTVGPVYDETNDQLIAIHAGMPPGTKKLKVGTRADKWDPKGMLDPPLGTRKLFREPDGGILVVSTLGVFRIAGDPTTKAEPVKIFGMTLPLPDSGPFEPVGPEKGLVLANPADVAIDPVTGDLATYSRGTLKVLKRNEQLRFDVAAEKQLSEDEAEPALVGITAGNVIVARREGQIEIRDAKSLEVRSEFPGDHPNAPRHITTSPDGRWCAVLYHNGRCWLFDSQQNRCSVPAIRGQGDISAASFSRNNELLICERATRVTSYHPETLAVVERFDHRLDWLATSYRYGVLPLYTIFPKPGELDRTFEYLLSGKETDSDSARDLTTSQRALDPWGPVWSSALFAGLVLLFTCIYFERQEF